MRIMEKVKVEIKKLITNQHTQAELADGNDTPRNQEESRWHIGQHARSRAASSGLSRVSRIALG